ncbi:MAG: 30S ribosomal protein S20 [Candidatus Pacebacteria bacterium]|nr:30S ribosomal protein S20 [Candidatus Paceibacterota bacterium]
MAIIQSAKRAIRGSERKRVYNERRSKAMKEVVKEVKALATAKDKKSAQALLAKAFKAIDKAAKTNFIKKNTASRKKSRLAKMIKKLA